MAACTAGTYSLAGDTSCTLCPSGSTSGAAASTCLCLPGFALTGSGVSLTCTACTDGTYSPAGAPCISKHTASCRGKLGVMLTVQNRLCAQHVQRPDGQQLHCLPCIQQCRRGLIRVRLPRRLLWPFGHRHHHPLHRYAALGRNGSLW
jgi:hypothetical protein